MIGIKMLRQARQLRTLLLHPTRRFSYAPPKGAGERDNSSFFSLLTMGAVVGGVAYVYYDPDVLPASVKKVLPIQEPKGHGMTLEEYEKWRAQQGGLPTVTGKKEEEKPAASSDDDDDDVNPPEADIPIPHGDVAPEEMKASLEKLLNEARENEAAFLADLKKTRAPVSEEDRQMIEAFKDEKARLKKQLKFIKSSK